MSEPEPGRDPRDLLGRWQLDRTLLDRTSGLRGCMHGSLVLSAEPDGRLRWFESGTLHWDGQGVAVTRTYRLSRGTDGWWVLFEDDRPFHPWAPGISVEHDCAPDRYRGLVVVRDPAAVSVRWEVRGPAKDHRYRSRLRRTRAGDLSGTQSSAD